MDPGEPGIQGALLILATQVDRLVARGAGGLQVAEDQLIERDVGERIDGPEGRSDLTGDGEHLLVSWSAPARSPRARRTRPIGP